MDETEFLYNDFTAFNKIELERVVKTVTSKPVKADPKAVFLKRFSYEVFNAYRRGKFHEVRVIEKPKEEVRAVERPIIKPEIKKIILDEPPKPIFRQVLTTREILNSGGIIIKADINNGVYSLIEPKLDERDVKIISALEKEIGKKLLKNNKLIGDKEFFTKEIDKVIRKMKAPIPIGYHEKLQYFLTRDFVNFGKIDGLLRDVDIKEIICDGVNKFIRLNFKGQEIVSNVIFTNKEELDNLIKKFADLAGKKISNKEPFLSAELSSGLKIQASLSSTLNDARFIIKK